MPSYPSIKECISAPKQSETSGLLQIKDGMLSWKNKKNNFVVLALHFEADPDKASDEWFHRATANLRQDQIDREYLLKANSRAGEKVFPYLLQSPYKFRRPASDYRKGSEFVIPRTWTIIAGLDYGGTQNPTAINFYAIDEKNRWHSFWEYYKPSHYMTIADVLKKHPLWSRVLKVVADPSIFNKNQNTFKDNIAVITSIADLLQDEGIYNLERGVNDRKAGLERVREKFNQLEGEDRESHFFISDDCPNQWREFTELIYKNLSPAELINKNPEDDTIKKNDHAFDNCKYAMLSWDISSDYEYTIENYEKTLHAIEREIDEKYEALEASMFN